MNYVRSEPPAQPFADREPRRLLAGRVSPGQPPPRRNVVLPRPPRSGHRRPSRCPWPSSTTPPASPPTQRGAVRRSHPHSPDPRRQPRPHPSEAHDHLDPGGGNPKVWTVRITGGGPGRPNLHACWTGSSPGRDVERRSPRSPCPRTATSPPSSHAAPVTTRTGGRLVSRADPADQRSGRGGVAHRGHPSGVGSRTGTSSW